MSIASPVLQMQRYTKSARVAPELSLMEWEEGEAPQPGTVRESYLAARFPGMALSATDLARRHEVIASARLIFQEGRPELALELLQVAGEEHPYIADYCLARLEIQFLSRDARQFIATAHEFRIAHPASEAWPQIERLGRALAPREALFAAPGTTSQDMQDAAWPDPPNWIDMRDDPAGEMLAAEFHQEMSQLMRTRSSTRLAA